MRDVMIDIETLDTRPSAVILEIGICPFDALKGEVGTGEAIEVSLNDNERLRRTASAATLNWWAEQERPMPGEGLSAVSLKQALLWLQERLHFCRGGAPDGKVCVWANSPSFDLVILEDAFRQLGLDVPWKFWEQRDVRTVLKLAGIRKGKVSHLAVDDCRRQAEYVTRAYEALAVMDPPPLASQVRKAIGSDDKPKWRLLRVKAFMRPEMPVGRLPLEDLRALAVSPRGIERALFGNGTGGFLEVDAEEQFTEELVYSMELDLKAELEERLEEMEKAKAHAAGKGAA